MHQSERLIGHAAAVAAKTALVLETNNLRGGDSAANALSSLKRLIERLTRQTLPPQAFAQWIITHDGLDARARADLVELAGRPVDFVEIGAQTGYYDAKNLGFEQVDATRCDYVAFGDADCQPAADWLERLLAPFGEAGAAALSAIAGRTTYSASMSGAALTTIDFMYFPSPLRAGATRNFYANNVAFRREVFEQYRYGKLEGVYRAHCQVMGLRLQDAGVVVHYAHDAHTEHRLPDSWRETVKLRWMRGEDSVALTPYIVRAYLPASLHWFARSGPLAPFCVMAGRLGFSLRALNHQGLPPQRGWRRVATVGLLIGISSVDTLGALVRGAGFGARRAAGRDAQALSYHRH
ncbi:glycosyltransferase family 2 protein [Paraburkholderia bryophila]|uniref:glycosyltransferase n=1 Tax=Paraburkholderia bryophila TaxID=420952 RepID=UPI0023494137|nr:glycosyltransferase family 2 protein [Paraburkholderia bryophila]WCM24227.1 glycosyltransferase family 2 protein [Paraburkholderia bryophila]